MNSLSRRQWKIVSAGVLSVVGLVNLVLWVLVLSWITTANPLPADGLGSDPSTTVFYDNRGNEVVRLSAEENRLWVAYADIPQTLKDAFVAVEDERFWTHAGIDPRRIVGAVLGLVTGGPGAGGGSTITQQLVKNLSGRWEPTLKRKVQEQWLALDLERRLTKERILELYLNVIYLGNGAYGVQSGAKGYFGKDVSALNLAESAFLAGLTKNPAKFGTQVPAARARQKTILAKMAQQGYITQAQRKAAVIFPITYVGAEVQKRVATYSWFVDAAIEDILSDLEAAYGWTDQVAQAKLFNGGLKVWLTEDPRVQGPMEQAFSRKDSPVFANRSRRTDGPQGAMVVLDPKTGHILGLVGGAGAKELSRGLNRATQTYRQPGSAIKPIGVYAPALDRGLVTEGTVEEDLPLHLTGGEEGQAWSPTNFEGTFAGQMTIRDAVSHSNNVVAVKTLLKVGVDESMAFLEALGITSLQPEDRQAALALGGLSKGVSVREMTGAYGAVANGGNYLKPVTYLKVEDHDGRLLLATTTQPRRVMEAETAYLVTDLMTEVMVSGTGRGFAVQRGKIETAGKTGTTSDVKDKWFVGFTPYLLGVSWYGYDRPRAFTSEAQQIRLWSEVMEAAHKNLGFAKADFREPSGLVHAAICIDSGLRPTDRCALDPRALAGLSRIRTYTFKAGTEPTEDCPVHGEPVAVDSQSGGRANPNCPPDDVVWWSLLKKPEPRPEAQAGDLVPLDARYEEHHLAECPLH